MEELRLQALKEVQSAIEVVEDARSAFDLKKEDKIIFEAISLSLSNIEQSIIKAIGEDLVSKLTTDTLELSALIDKIDKSAQSLDMVVKIISKSTEVVNTLIKAIGNGLKLL